MRRFLLQLPAFLFRPVSALGFGMMRSSWAAVCLVYLLMIGKDVTEFFSAEGLLPPELAAQAMRQTMRFTVLEWITTPEAVFALYLLLLLSLFLACIGMWPRFTTILSTVLLFSFHERDPFPFGGGDTVLRILAFLLCVAPCLDAFSVKRLDPQWKHFKKTRTLLPPPLMPIWPYRLLLWQFFVLYATSTWFKLKGSMWLAGTAVDSALHHPVFSRLSPKMAHLMSPFTPIVTFGAIAWQTTWLLVMLPERLRRFVFRGHNVKLWVLLGGVLFHGSILLLMDAGSFSMAIFAGYIGLFLEEDIAAIRSAFNRRTRGPIAILYDGHCGLCMRSIFTLKILDNLRRLQPVDFWNKTEKQRVAPDLKIADLDKAMHVRLPDGRTFKGFDGVRQIAWHLPALWPLAPFLYVPGVPAIGRAVYARVATRRKQCNHESCVI